MEDPATESTLISEDQVVQYRDAKDEACAPADATQVYVHDLKTGSTMRGSIAPGDGLYKFYRVDQERDYHGRWVNEGASIREQESLPLRKGRAINQPINGRPPWHGAHPRGRLRNQPERMPTEAIDQLRQAELVGKKGSLETKIGQGAKWGYHGAPERAPLMPPAERAAGEFVPYQPTLPGMRTAEDQRDLLGSRNPNIPHDPQDELNLKGAVGRESGYHGAPYREPQDNVPIGDKPVGEAHGSDIAQGTLPGFGQKTPEEQIKLTGNSDFKEAESPMSSRAEWRAAEERQNHSQGNGKRGVAFSPSDDSLAMDKTWTDGRARTIDVFADDLGRHPGRALSIIKNPTGSEIAAWAKQDGAHYLRYGIDFQHGNVFVWDANKAIHNGVMYKLGLGTRDQYQAQGFSRANCDDTPSPSDFIAHLRDKTAGIYEKHPKLPPMVSLQRDDMEGYKKPAAREEFHDVSAEARDERGRWTDGGNAGLTDREMLATTIQQGGLTYQPFSKQSPQPGDDVYVVATHSERGSGALNVATLTPSDLHDYIAKNLDLLVDTSNYFGTWKSGDNVYLDIVTLVKDRDEAIALGKQHNQIAIFSFKTMTEIETGGSGVVKHGRHTEGGTHLAERRGSAESGEHPEAVHDADGQDPDGAGTLGLGAEDQGDEEIIEFYDENEARDERGRWTAGGGTATTMPPQWNLATVEGRIRKVPSPAQTPRLIARQNLYSETWRDGQARTITTLEGHQLDVIKNPTQQQLERWAETPTIKLRWFADMKTGDYLVWNGLKAWHMSPMWATGVVPIKGGGGEYHSKLLFNNEDVVSVKDFSAQLTQYLNDQPEEKRTKILAKLNRKTFALVFAWDEAAHPRGKTSEGSTPGSFAPADGGDAPSGGFNADKWRAMGMGKAREEWAKLSRKEKDAAANARVSIGNRVKELISSEAAPKTGSINEDVTFRVLQNSDKLPEDSQTAIAAFGHDMAATFDRAGIDPEIVRQLTLDITDHVIAQDIESQGRTLGDHGIAHIAQDLAVARQTLNAIPGYTLDPKTEAAMYIATALHDSGYLTPPAGAFLDDAHPRWGSQYYMAEFHGEVADALGQDTADQVSTMIYAHDQTIMDWDREPELSALAMADNLALFHAEKMPALVRFIPSNTSPLIQLAEGKISVDEAKNAIHANIDRDGGYLPAAVSTQLHHAVEEVSGKLPKYMLGMVGTRMGGVTWKGDHPNVTIYRYNANESLSKVLDIGQQQFRKLAENYHYDPDDFIKSGNMVLREGDRTLLEAHIVHHNSREGEA